MEKLEASQREAIKKTSSLRLSMKLLEAGFEESEVQAMDRSQLMASWAELVVVGKDKPVATGGVVGYDPELEKRRLDFEMQKFEEERKWKEKELQDRRTRYEEEMRMKARELKIQEDRAKMSASLVNQTKIYADALKGTITTMPLEVVHLLTYFADVERLFARFEVPDELQAHLLRPYLNDKAKVLVSRMDPAKANDYKEVKTMLLREFKLSPSVYLEKFNTDKRNQDETCLLYSSRLVAILDA